MRKFFAIMAALFISAVFSCSPEVRYETGITEKHGSREWGPLEIKLTVEKMVESIHAYLKNDWNGPVYLQVKRFRNRTGEHIDTRLITDEISTQLMRRRITFIDDSLSEESIEQMKRGMTGMYDEETAVPTGELKSPNLYLTGSIRESVSEKGNRKLQYLVVTMQLYEIKTGEVKWQDQAHFLKSIKKKDSVGF
ncbi:MAG: hypothetical protein ACOC2H_00120 [Spirochaetota bacterium]